MLSHLIVWAIVGLIGGGLAGFVMKGDRQGFGIYRNLGLGLAGAVVGGVLFQSLQLLVGLDSISISLRDVVSAFVGSLIVLLAIWLWEKYGRR